MADFGLLRTAVGYAEARGLNYRVGNILSSDVFYANDSAEVANWQKVGILAVEMESAALYMNAARLGKKALSVLTVSDVPGETTSASAEEREKAFTDMMLVALDTAAFL
jgi:purine-nucleoside phosphorylase